MLAERGIPVAERGGAGTDLFGLWDLTAPAGGAGATPGLLRSAGFVPAGAGRAAAHVGAPRTGAPADDESSWWELEL